MKHANLFQFYNEINALKKTIRYSIFKKELQESTADHSWRLALLVLDIKDEFNLPIDVTYAVKIALVHDICEYQDDFDIPAVEVMSGFISKESKSKEEEETMRELSKRFNRPDVYDAWYDYETQNSKEAKLVKLLDKVESTMHIISEATDKSAIMDPYHAATYCDVALKKVPGLKAFIIELKYLLKLKYEELGIEWKQEYSEFAE